MNTEAIEILNAICEKIGVAIDWTGENVMPQLESLIEQYARYLLVSNIVGLVVSVLALIGGIVLGVVVFKSYNSGSWAVDDWDDLSIIGWVAAIAAACFAILGAIGLICTVDAVIKSATIPQIYAAQKLLQMILQ